MQTLKQNLVDCSPEQLEAIFHLWGMSGLDKKNKLQQRFDLLLKRVKELIAARFVWEYLTQDERVILYRILAPASRGGARRDATFKKIGLSEKNFEAAVTSLKHRLLLWEDTAKIRNERYLSGNRKSTTSYEEVNLLHPYAESMDALYASGRELLSEKGDRSQTTFDKILATFTYQELASLGKQSYDVNPGDYYSVVELREIIQDQLAYPQSAYEILTKLNAAQRGLFKWLCEQGGKVGMDEVRRHTGYDDTTLSTMLNTFEEYLVAFDTFSEGRRVLFVPSDIKASLTKAATEPISEQQPADLVILAEPPLAIRDSITSLLYDMAIIVGATYQQAIEPTQAGNVPKRLGAKIQPLLHGKTRVMSYEHEDRYMEMIFDIAQELGVVRLSNAQVEGIKQRYEPAASLPEWSQLDVVAQTQKLLDNWVKGFRWIDIMGINYRQTESFYYWKPALARGVILEHLKGCVPGRWYTVESLLDMIWEKHPFAVRETVYMRKPDQRKTGAQHIKWRNADGELYVGLLNSSLFEMGIVQLGYQQPELPDANHPRNPDAFMITPLGAAVLELPIAENTAQAETIPTALPERSRVLVLQPNFEILLLHFDPPTLYSLLPFAQVQQVEMVSRLALNRNSVLRGMEAGLDIDAMIAILEQHSQKDIPQNVAYTLRDWVKLYKDARISQVFMLEVSGEIVADELIASSKFKAYRLRKLAPRVLVAPGDINIQDLRRVIEKEGIIARLSGEIITPKNRYSMASAGTLR